ERRIEALLQSFDLRLPEGAEREAALARLREQLRPRAERQVRSELLLDALAARDAIVVSDDELDAEVEAIAARERQVVERVRALWPSSSSSSRRIRRRTSTCTSTRRGAR